MKKNWGLKLHYWKTISQNNSWLPTNYTILKLETEETKTFLKYYSFQFLKFYSTYVTDFLNSRKRLKQSIKSKYAYFERWLLDGFLNQHCKKPSNLHKTLAFSSLNVFTLMYKDQKTLQCFDCRSTKEQHKRKHLVKRLSVSIVQIRQTT